MEPTVPTLLVDIIVNAQRNSKEKIAIKASFKSKCKSFQHLDTPPWVMVVLCVASYTISRFGVSRQAGQGHLLSGIGRTTAQETTSPTLCDQWVASLTSHSINEQVLWYGTYALSSLSEKLIIVVVKKCYSSFIWYLWQVHFSRYKKKVHNHIL